MSWPRLSFWRSGAYYPMWPIKEQFFLETYQRHQGVSLHLVFFLLCSLHWSTDVLGTAAPREGIPQLAILRTFLL